jgi:hypothetical protein
MTTIGQFAAATSAPRFSARRAVWKRLTPPMVPPGGGLLASGFGLPAVRNSQKPISLKPPKA